MYFIFVDGDHKASDRNMQAAIAKTQKLAALYVNAAVTVDYYSTRVWGN